MYWVADPPHPRSHKKCLPRSNGRRDLWVLGTERSSSSCILLVVFVDMSRPGTCTRISPQSSSNVLCPACQVLDPGEYKKEMRLAI